MRGTHREVTPQLAKTSSSRWMSSHPSNTAQLSWPKLKGLKQGHIRLKRKSIARDKWIIYRKSYKIKSKKWQLRSSLKQVRKSIIRVRGSRPKRSFNHPILNIIHRLERGAFSRKILQGHDRDRQNSENQVLSRILPVVHRLKEILRWKVVGRLCVNSIKSEWKSSQNSRMFLKTITNISDNSPFIVSNKTILIRFKLVLWLSKKYTIFRYWFKLKTKF